MPSRRIRDLDVEQRAREYYHGLRLLPGAWTVIRVDGRGFSKFTNSNFEKPFDPEFAALMEHTAETLLVEFGGRYAYTESDEISVLLPPEFDLFDRSVEKLVSISAGLASAAFSLKSGHLAHFDSRLWVGNTEADVLDYFSWRQADASRCALNGWCYWVQRQAGLSAGKATARMRGLGFSAKNEILYEYGVNFNELPLWQRRGVGLWWETYEKTGHDPVKGIDVVATRRRVRIDRELPMKDEYRELVGSVSSAEPAR